jgi:peroxiredoxin
MKFCGLLLMFMLTFFKSPEGLAPGDQAKDFKLKNIDGNMVSMADYKNAKGFIVVFSCNHCPYVKAYEGRIEALNKMYEAKGFPVIAINPNDPVQYPEDSFENMQRNAKQKGFSFPYLMDESQEVAKSYGALKTPHVYVLERKDKNYIVRYVGAIDDNTHAPENVTKKYVEDAVNAIMAGRTVKIQSSKAIGCGIKWK